MLKIIRVLAINIALISLGILGVEIVWRIGKIRPNFSSSKLLVHSFVKPILNYSTFHLDQGNYQRKPHPYVMFKGAPDKLDHNSLGFRFSFPAEDSSINIALFGGSTGYNGNPPIIDLIVEKLNKDDDFGQKFVALNYSVVSSNHNQHLHSLVQNYKNFPIDIVIFYGGYNETLQTAFYDSRPGYPYNFNITNEMMPEKMFFIKHFSLYNELKNLIQRTEYVKLKNDLKEGSPFSPTWNKKIVKNYIDTTTTANVISKVLTTGRCENPYIFIYQPYQMPFPSVPKNFKKEVHENLVKYAKESDYGIDISDVFGIDVQQYTDIAHITQKAKDILAQNIVDTTKFKDVVNSCKLK